MTPEVWPPADQLAQQLACDPYPVYRQLRRSGRPLFMPHACSSAVTSGRWLLSTYAQASQVLADTTHFTKLSGAFRVNGPEPGFDASMLFQDEPEHRRLRSCVEDLFRRRPIDRYQAMAHAAAERLFDGLPFGCPVDLVEMVAEPLPLLILSGLLGLPEMQIPVLARLSQAIRSATDDLIISDAEQAEKAAATLALHELLQAGLDGAWSLPDDSLMGRLQGLLADRSLSREQAISMVILLLFAGHETTAALIGSAVHLLLAHQDQRRRLLAEPDLLPAFIEECVRLESPLQRSTYRMAACELELYGQPLAAGEQVCVLLGSANRDERMFSDSESFRLDRTPNPHLAFGRGNYHCLGRHLAILEVSVVLRIFMKRFPASSLAGEPIWNVNGFLRSLQHLPVSLQS